jgi:transposase
MRHRYELPQQHWERLAPLFPDPTHHGGRGRPWEDHRRTLNGILWRLHTGAPWRDLPERYGPWQRIYSRFQRWRRDGTWATVLTRLLEELEREGRLGHDLWLVDATIVRASRAASGAEKKSGRGAGPGRAEAGATRRAS